MSQKKKKKASPFINWIQISVSFTKDRVEDGAADGIECAVHNGFGGGRDFLGDWFGFFSLLLLPFFALLFSFTTSRCLLIRLSTIQWYYYYHPHLSVHPLWLFLFSIPLGFRLLISWILLLYFVPITSCKINK
ncbi:hypothetical protein NC652_021240 [Populus alba x Populus x berolinensis]|nr:hypothetical protein NC652_021240 [Populus alba x Populus x berolinensis]